jgi:hypothetical protein
MQGTTDDLFRRAAPQRRRIVDQDGNPAGLRDVVYISKGAAVHAIRAGGYGFGGRR